MHAENAAFGVVDWAPPLQCSDWEASPSPDLVLYAWLLPFSTKYAGSENLQDGVIFLVLGHISM